MPKLTQTLKKLQKYQTNPEVFASLSPNELAGLVVHVMGAVKTLQTAIESGQLDIGEKLKKDIAAAVAEGNSKQSAIAARMEQIVTEAKNKTNDANTKLTADVEAALANLQTTVDGLTNGEDGIVTEAEIYRAATIASELIDLPDFDELVNTAITSNGGAVRDALELLQGDDRLSIDAISGTENWRKEMAELKRNNPNAGLGGFGPNTVRKMIAESGGGASISDEAYGITWDGVTDEGASKNAIYDKIESLAGGHDPVTVTDSSEIDFTLTDQDITASLIAGSIDESKLDTSVNESLDLADSASQPGHTHTASEVTDFETEVSNNAAVTANTAKVSNATHTGDVTGSTALTIANDAVTAAKLDESDDFTPTGSWDFGGATDVELPNGAAPTVDTDGQVAIDTDIADLSHGLMKYFAGEEVVTVSMPLAQLAALNNGWGPAYNAAADEFQMTAPASGSGDTYNVSVNTLTIDSTAGTSDTWGVLGGAVNGSNTTYTVSTGIYKSGTLKVFKNNLLLVQGSGEDWVETTPGSGTFDFNDAPLSDDVITVEYSDQDTTANSLIVEKDTTTVSANYTALATDRNILVNAAAGDITVTLPATTSIDSVGLTIKKIDTSGNVVTIATPASETIDNDTSDSLDEPLRAKTIFTDGSNYFNK